jgi:hypothetical protein
VYKESKPTPIFNFVRECTRPPNGSQAFLYLFSLPGQTQHTLKVFSLTLHEVF